MHPTSISACVIYRYRTGLACVAFVLLVIDLLAMLAGGFVWYPWVPTTLVALSATFSLIPASRTAGIIGSVLWGVLAVIGIEHEKYFGPLGFAALSALLVAMIMLFAPALARWSIVPIAFLEGAWPASLARQATFEVATLGYVTRAVDPCGAYFLPVIFAVFVVVVVITAALLQLLTSFAIVNDVWGRIPDAAGILWGKWRVALAIAVAAGTTLGFGMWRDWQINQPCM